MRLEPPKKAISTVAMITHLEVESSEGGEDKQHQMSMKGRPLQHHLEAGLLLLTGTLYPLTSCRQEPGLKILA